jgi:hypothetical protein
LPFHAQRDVMLVANLGRSMSTEFFGLDSNAKHPNHLAFEKSSNAAPNAAGRRLHDERPDDATDAPCEAALANAVRDKNA